MPTAKGALVVRELHDRHGGVSWPAVGPILADDIGRYGACERILLDSDRRRRDVAISAGVASPLRTCHCKAEAERQAEGQSRQKQPELLCTPFLQPGHSSMNPASRFAHLPETPL